ncbi:FtsK/SpoIIIE domain-containing protein [Actinomadura roseirufa]|uniref:FtsK/SpoIIIE domain-containing protein n=1 Tax=Actinomadura roseirufa TaxID=2094049 RepID=UPI0013F179F0|nr:FtsK/SpoIIIE domain-containing protein [Actinomadura roseirufa]
MNPEPNHEKDPDDGGLDAEIVIFPQQPGTEQRDDTPPLEGRIVKERAKVPEAAVSSRAQMAADWRASGEMLVSRVGEMVKRPDVIVAAVIKHELVFGPLGTGRGIAAVWRWATARELDAQFGTNPKMVLDLRKSRQRMAGAAFGMTVLSSAVMWASFGPSLVTLSALLGLGVAGAAERKIRAAGTTHDDGRKALGTHPGSKAVRLALANAKLGKHDQLRVIGAVTRDGDAWIATVELPPGTPYRTAAKKRPEIASAIGVDEVQVALDPVKGHNGRVKLWVADEDPMQGSRVENPIVSQAGPVDFWHDKVFAGRDARGREVAFSLVERSYLIGGEPGGGKSVASNNILTFASMDPYIDLYLGDGKYGFDQMLFEPLAQGVIGDRQGHDPVMEMLETVREEMNRRYKLLRKLGTPKITREIAVKYGINPVLLHLDEIQTWSASGDTKLDKAFVLSVADIVGRGRAAAIVTGAVTQRPAAEVVPTRLRDILSIRWALRCTTPDASDTILGSGRAGQGYSAATFNADQRGAGFLLSEGALPIQTRSAFLNESELSGLATRAYDLRRSAGTLPASAERPGVKLLLAVLEAMGGHPKGAHTADILAALTRMGGYADWEPTKLAAALKPLGVFPRQVDIDGRNRNGYRREDVTQALDRA